MLKDYLNLLCLVVLCSSLEVQTLTRQKLDHLKLYPDFTHHFVFFHTPTLDAIRQDLKIWDNQHDIKFYTNDCKGNKLPECDSPESTPILLMYNRVLMKFNGDPANMEDIKQWMDLRITKNTKIITNEQQLTQMLEKTPNVYCLCTNDKLENDQSVFFALAKELPFLNYCVIRNEIYYKTLDLKPGNLTYFKNSTTNREQFIYPNRLEAWEWFIKSHMLHRLPRVTEVVAERYAQKQKNLNFYVLACDLSFTCEKVWTRVKELESQLINQTLGFNFYIGNQDQRESFNFNLYYHITFNIVKLPALIHINLQSDRARAGDLVRHIEFTSADFSIETLKDFKRRAEGGEIKPFYFSDKVPPKNGFTGKGSEKFIQKLVASNIEEVIKNSPNHYILLISALNIGCTRCEEFYKEYKQIASLLIDKDVTFGYLDANKNEVSLQQTAQMPDLFIFKKDNKTNPIRLDIPMSFDHLRNFIRDTLGQEYYDPDEL